MKYKTKQTIAGYAFLAPALVVFVMMVLVPVIISLVLSFTKWNYFSGIDNIKWVGINNFRKMFTTDRSFRTALGNTVVYAVTTVPTTIFLALILAHIVNGKVLAQRFFRLAFFIPYISNMVALGAIFKFLFRTDGPVNMVLTGVFQMAAPPNWLVDTRFSRVPIMMVTIYAGIGFCLIVYIAALKNVPRDLYEAASIDGASPARQFFSITLPLVSPTTFYLIIIRLINAFQIFAAINIISAGGKSSGSVSLVVLIYEEAFKKYNFGYASAESWILVAFIMGVTLINFVGQKKWVHY